MRGDFEGETNDELMRGDFEGEAQNQLRPNQLRPERKLGRMTSGGPMAASGLEPRRARLTGTAGRTGAGAA